MFLDTASYEWTIHGLLRHVGAVSADRQFTNAGALFFSSNPQRDLPYAHIRVLRFDVSLDHQQDRSPPSFDRSFYGPITKQIRDFRSFLKESGFFKTYLKRRPEGGFEELPELPPIAVDEAIVNAVAHRDYAVGNAIRCEKYTDGIIVRSPGNSPAGKMGAATLLARRNAARASDSKSHADGVASATDGPSWQSVCPGS